MENREAIHKLESMRNTCQKLIDEKVKFERLVGTDVTETWNAETPFDGACQNLIEAVTMAISALKKLEAIKSCTPPSDDWEHYADRLHDIAYKYGYEEGKRDAGRWTPVSENLPEDGKDVLCIAKSKFGGFYCVASHGKMYPGSNEVGWITSDYARLDESVILAWMPLPQPYQEEEA